MNTIIAKLFAGSFNEDNIGHEVINLYKHDQADKEGENGFYYLYIPPYGSVGTKGFSAENSFLSKPTYKDCQNILFVLKTDIPYTFKIIAYAKAVIPFKNQEEILNTAKSINYNEKPLNDIPFISMNDEDGSVFDDSFVSKLTYKVTKGNYFDLRSHNLFIYPKKNKNAKDSIKNNKKQTEEKYDKSQFFDNMEFLNTWHNYTYFYDNKEFDSWFKNNLEKFIIKENLFILPFSYSTPSNNKIIYNSENVLRFIDKENDENIVTNMMKRILQKCPSIADSFLTFLGEKAKIKLSFGKERKIEKQYSSLTYSERIELKYLSARNVSNREEQKKILIKLGYTENQIESLQKPKEGYIDLFIEGENFRLVIENKVKSGLNDIYSDDNNNQTSQLDKYKKFLDECNKEDSKDNNILFIFAPNYHCHFQTGNVECTLVKYSELYNFFNSIKLCDIQLDTYYYNLFLNTLAKHSRSLEDEIRGRFISITSSRI